MRDHARAYAGKGRIGATLGRALAAVLLVLSFRAAAQEFREGTIGVNKYDLVQQYLEGAASSKGALQGNSDGLSRAKKAIDDAHKLGISYFRLPITGYAPSVPGAPGDLDLWISNPTQYWAAIDVMMRDLR